MLWNSLDFGFFLNIKDQYGIRFDNNEQAEAFVFQLAEEVARRLDDVHMRGRSVTLKVMKRDPAAPVEGPKVGRAIFPNCWLLLLTFVVEVPGTRPLRNI